MKQAVIRPRAKHVLVAPDGEESRESGLGIITPATVEQESKAFGTVIAVGADIDDIEEGARVIYGAFAGEQISLKGSKKKVDFVLLHQEDVLAFIEE